MSFLRVSKQTKLALLFGLLIVCVLYLTTMGRADSLRGSLTMTEPIWRPLYVGETAMKNPIRANAFFASTHTFAGGPGCPCIGIFKPLALLSMLGTWQFYANWLIFSLTFYISYSILQKKMKLE